MNRMTKSVWVAAIAALAVTPLLAKSGGRRGTNILHFNVRIPMVNDDTTGSNNASGTCTASQATQGNADKETLTVTARHLSPNTPYTLLISTTTSGLTALPNPFNSDRKGNLALKLTNGKLGKHNIAIPSNDVPVSTIQEVDLEDSNSTPVLTAEFAGLTNATSLQYLVKQDISTNNGTNSVSASLQVKATLNRGTSRSSATVTASGLQADNSYVLVFNGSPVATNTASSRGRLRITSSDTPPDILDLTSVDVTDTNNAPVTGTATLP